MNPGTLFARGFSGSGHVLFFFLQEMPPLHLVNRDVGEMPEGAHYSDDNDADERPEDDPHKALDINLDEYVIL